MATLAFKASNTGVITSPGKYLLLKTGDTIQFNGKTATVSYFKPNPPALIYEIDNKPNTLQPEELDSVQKVTGGRKTRKSRKSRKSRRYRRV
jgi:hypothetical protein